MSRESWCSEQSRLLKTTDNRLPILSDIKDHISQLPHEEAKQTSCLLQLPLVFDCLNDSNEEQIELACDVLTLCLSNLTLGEGTSRYYLHIGRALNHPHAQVKTMALNEVLRDSIILHQVLDQDNYEMLITHILRCLGDKDLGVASLASETIVEICKNTQAIGVLGRLKSEGFFRELLDSDEVVRMRFYEVFIKVASGSNSSMIELEKYSFVSSVVKSIDTPDVLLQLNIIELLSVFVITDWGYDYLDRKGVIKKLENSLNDSENQIYLQLCEPGILKFFGQIAHHNPRTFLTKHPMILHRLFQNITSKNPSNLSVTLNTLSYIIDTDESKIEIDKVGDDLYRTIGEIVDSLGILPNEIKIVALNCLANFISVEFNERKVTEVTRKWFGFMKENPMDWIIRYAKNPFQELRIAGLVVLNSLAKQYWGQEVMRNTPGLVEFLLDRNVETMRECKLIKYEIVKRIADSPAFSREMQELMQSFVAEGPFYVRGVTEIALEGED